jgi:uncharacterized protein (DUF305 family)
MKTLVGITLFALAVTAGVSSLAQRDDRHHADHTMDAPPGEATQAYEAANAEMHQAMAISYSGNADIDFARGMIPHHRGAIAMANVVLKHGTDPEIRKLAEDIITAQEKEIAWMDGWLKKQGQ